MTNVLKNIFLTMLVCFFGVLSYNILAPSVRQTNDEVWGSTRATAQVAPTPQKEIIKLPWGQRLESVSWACHPAGYCEPWALFRPLRADELPENHHYWNPRTGAEYIFTESRIPH